MAASVQQRLANSSEGWSGAVVDLCGGLDSGGADLIAHISKEFNGSRIESKVSNSGVGHWP